MIRRAKSMAAVTALAFLFGCSAFVGRDVEQIRDAEPGGSAFTRDLTEEYRELALFEAEEMHDWVDADRFARKGLRTARGEIVLPEHLDAWRLDPGTTGELAHAREHLMRALDRGAHKSQPRSAARAQGRFDCWVEQQEENHQPEHIAACRESFYAALARLEGAPGAQQAVLVPEAGPLPAAGAFVVFFALNSARLGAEAAAVIEKALTAAAERGTGGLAVVGHTDRAGGAAYNRTLSLKRAQAVRRALLAPGTAPEDIRVAARGEAEPAVPTPDGVAEQANRRVEIILR